jgi:pyruvate dehydrogenase E2 component (dihydrolipoamide acetyltransferase)
MDVVLPKWGVTMQEATLAEWRVDEGASISAGDALAQIVTDKIDVDLEAPVGGVLAKRCVEAGDVVAVGAVVAVIEEA